MNSELKLKNFKIAIRKINCYAIAYYRTTIQSLEHQVAAMQIYIIPLNH